MLETVYIYVVSNLILFEHLVQLLQHKLAV